MRTALWCKNTLTMNQHIFKYIQETYEISDRRRPSHASSRPGITLPSRNVDCIVAQNTLTMNQHIFKYIQEKYEISGGGGGGGCGGPARPRAARAGPGPAFRFLAGPPPVMCTFLVYMNMCVYIFIIYSDIC